MRALRSGTLSGTRALAHSEFVTSGRERLFIDYDCFRRTGGDVEQARAAAADIVRVAITQ